MYCDENRPSEDQVVKAFRHNHQGAGAAWRENDEVVWEKGLFGDKGLERVIEIAEVTPLPYVLHFRLVSVGAEVAGLCHPFPIAPSCPLLLRGRYKGPVLFHNGTYGRWRDVALETAVKYNKPLPPGKWSDTRLMAWAASIYGPGFLEFTDEKLCFFAPTGWPEENGGEVEFYGSWDVTGPEGHKIYVTNKSWEFTHVHGRGRATVGGRQPQTFPSLADNEEDERLIALTATRVADDDHGWGSFHRNNDERVYCSKGGCTKPIPVANKGSGRCDEHYVCLFGQGAAGCKREDLVKGTRFCPDHQYNLTKEALAKRIAQDANNHSATSAMLGPMSNSRMKPICAVSNCPKDAMAMSRYCVEHARREITCDANGCQEINYLNTRYCRKHQLLVTPERPRTTAGFKVVCAAKDCEYVPLAGGRFCSVHADREVSKKTGVDVDVNSIPFPCSTGLVQSGAAQPQQAEEGTAHLRGEGANSGSGAQGTETQTKLAAIRNESSKAEPRNVVGGRVTDEAAWTRPITIPTISDEEMEDYTV